MCVPLQVGLNGVDNGAIRFSHVRVPRVNLLDKFATVDKSGRYSSPLTSEVSEHEKFFAPENVQVIVLLDDVAAADLFRLGTWQLQAHKWPASKGWCDAYALHVCWSHHPCYCLMLK